MTDQTGTYLKWQKCVGGVEPFPRALEEYVLKYLPKDAYETLPDKIVITCMHGRRGLRFPPSATDNRHVIVISDEFFQPAETLRGSCAPRYLMDKELFKDFISAVLHELAHAYLDHPSPSLDGVDQKDVKRIEKEASDLAVRWIDDYKANGPYSR